MPVICTSSAITPVRFPTKRSSHAAALHGCARAQSLRRSRLERGEDIADAAWQDWTGDRRIGVRAVPTARNIQHPGRSGRAGDDAGWHCADDRRLPAGHRGSVPGAPATDALQRGDGRAVARPDRHVPCCSPRLRGRYPGLPRAVYRSDGDFNPFLQEIADGYDAVEWCGSRPWSDGNVGMYGTSYVGATQAATAAPPSLRAIAPAFTASDYYEGWTYQGGALSKRATGCPLPHHGRSAAHQRAPGSARLR